MMNNLLAYSSQQAAAAQMLQGYGNMANIPMPAASGKTQHQPVSVDLIPLPFYDVKAQLVTPTALVARGTNRFQVASYQFQLTVEQANQIALNRDLRQSAKINHIYQVQLRFCALDTTAEQSKLNFFYYKTFLTSSTSISDSSSIVIVCYVQVMSSLQVSVLK